MIGEHNDENSQKHRGHEEGHLVDMRTRCACLEEGHRKHHRIEVPHALKGQCVSQKQRRFSKHSYSRSIRTQNRHDTRVHGHIFCVPRTHLISHSECEKIENKTSRSRSRSPRTMRQRSRSPRECRPEGLRHVDVVVVNAVGACFEAVRYGDFDPERHRSYIMLGHSYG